MPPSLLALALVLQTHDNVADEEARDRARFDLRWKTALGIGVMDKPFAKSTLQEFRAQLVLHQRQAAIFQESLKWVRTRARQGAFGKNKQVRLALDTTAILGRGAVKDTYVPVVPWRSCCITTLLSKTTGVSSRSDFVRARQSILPVMGQTHVDAIFTGPNGKTATVELLVDSGARYTLLPYEVWQELGLQPERGQRFTLADGSHVQRKISSCRIQLDQGATYTPVILGEPGDQPLLGVVTLEELGLVLYPFSRELKPALHILA